MRRRLAIALLLAQACATGPTGTKTTTLPPDPDASGRYPGQCSRVPLEVMEWESPKPNNDIDNPQFQEDIAEVVIVYRPGNGGHPFALTFRNLRERDNELEAAVAQRPTVVCEGESKSGD